MKKIRQTTYPFQRITKVINNSKKEYISIANKNIAILVPAAGSNKSACNYKSAFKDDGFINIGSRLVIDEIKKRSNLKLYLAIKKKR